MLFRLVVLVPLRVVVGETSESSLLLLRLRLRPRDPLPLAPPPEEPPRLNLRKPPTNFSKTLPGLIFELVGGRAVLDVLAVATFEGVVVFMPTVFLFGVVGMLGEERVSGEEMKFSAVGEGEGGRGLSRTLLLR